MEQIREYLTSLGAIWMIAAAVHFLLHQWRKRQAHFNSLKWQAANERRVNVCYSWPNLLVFAPTFEELYCRAPLLLAASIGILPGSEWWWIFLSAGVFAALHWPGNYVSIPEVVKFHKNGWTTSDDLIVEWKKMYMAVPTRQKYRQKAMQVVVVFILGVLTGYYGLLYETLWVCVGIHTAWNVVAALILPRLVAFGIDFWCAARKSYYRTLAGR